jgi:hypothetical protein
MFIFIPVSETSNVLDHGMFYMDHQYVNKLYHISALFQEFIQLRMVVCYQNFGTTYCSHLHGPNGPRRLLGLLDP